ncbi:hypothetical protein Bca101_031113 [Brassica carinata]
MFNQRTRIHASVELNLIKKYEDDLAEGDAKVIQLFKVNLVVGDYRTSILPFFGFFQTTSLTNADDFQFEVPENYFADNNDILYEKLDNTYLVGKSNSITFSLQN